jgi:hypothetical protein
MIAYSAFFVIVFALYCQTEAGKTTRYWDCCKPSCAWTGKAAYKTHGVKTCLKDGHTVDTNLTAKSGCDGGPAFMCADNQPWVVNDNMAYGFAAAHVSGQKESDWCCACYELTFTSGPVSGKKMVVQVTNSGSDLGDNHFDLQIPGGGVGIFNGCQAQYNSPADGWGQRYGGVSSESQCSSLPTDLQPGCKFRFEWFKNADNPSVDMKKIKCPAELTGKTGCIRSDE